MIRNRIAALIAVLGPFALAAGWLTGYALDDGPAPYEPRSTPWEAPVITPEAAGPVAPITTAPATRVQPAAEVAPKPARVEPKPIPVATTTSPPRPVATTKPAPSTKASPPGRAPAAPKPKPVVEPEPKPAPEPQPEPVPEPERPRWTTADDAAANEVCVGMFGPGSTATNTPAIGAEYNPELRYPCLRPKPDPAQLPSSVG